MKKGLGMRVSHSSVIKKGESHLSAFLKNFNERLSIVYNEFGNYSRFSRESRRVNVKVQANETFSSVEHFKTQAIVFDRSN